VAGLRTELLDQEAVPDALQLVVQSIIDEHALCSKLPANLARDKHGSKGLDTVTKVSMSLSTDVCRVIMLDAFFME
jgi:hypothetical protein